jgi:hypothetical protein
MVELGVGVAEKCSLKIDLAAAFASFEPKTDQFSVGLKGCTGFWWTYPAATPASSASRCDSSSPSSHSGSSPESRACT